VPTANPTASPTTSYPTASSPIHLNCTLSLTASFDELWSFVNGNESELFQIATEIIEFALDLSSTDSLDAVQIEIFRVRNGSVIIDYDLAADSAGLLDLALSSIADTVSAESTFELEDSNLTLQFASNAVMTSAPTAGPTASPTVPPSFGPTEHPTSAPTVDPNAVTADPTTNSAPTGSPTATTLIEEASKTSVFGFEMEEIVAIGSAVLLFPLCVVCFVFYHKKKQRRRSKAEQSVGLTPYAPSGMSYDSYKRSQLHKETKRQGTRTLQKPRAMPLPSTSTAEDMHDVDVGGSFNSRKSLISIYDEDTNRRADTPEKSHSKSDYNPFLGDQIQIEPVEISDPGTPLKSEIMNAYDE